MSVEVTDVSTTLAEVIIRVDDDSTQVTKMSVTKLENSSSQDHSHPDDQATPSVIRALGQNDKSMQFLSVFYTHRLLMT